MRDLQSASTVVLDSKESNANLNNNSDPTVDEFTDDNDIIMKSSSKIEIGQVVQSTVSNDSVYARTEASDTQTQELVDNEQDDKTVACQDPTKPEGATEEVVSQEHTVPEIALEQQHQDGYGTPPPEEEDDTVLPSSSDGRKENGDECISVSQLPKVIVKNSITAAINRLSLKDSRSEDDKELKGTDHESMNGEKNLADLGAAEEAQENQVLQQDTEQTTTGEGGMNKGNGEQSEQLNEANVILSYVTDLEGQDGGLTDEENASNPDNSLVDKAKPNGQDPSHEENKDEAGVDDNAPNVAEKVATVDNDDATEDHASDSVEKHETTEVEAKESDDGGVSGDSAIHLGEAPTVFVTDDAEEPSNSSPVHNDQQELDKDPPQ